MRGTGAWLVLLLLAPLAAAASDLESVAQQDVVEVLTHDEDGELRETKVWITGFDGRAYVRTNDSRWLANIRRGSEVALRADEQEHAVAARETDDAEIAARVEAAFKEKYGLMQRVMSFFRVSEPTLLELTPR